VCSKPAGSGLRVEVPEQAKLGAIGGSVGEGAQGGQVFGVHRQDEVEAIEVGGHKGSGKTVELKTVLRRRPQHAAIGRLAIVEA
jgi:hypothetical protein